jgi:hypothetical protein
MMLKTEHFLTLTCFLLSVLSSNAQNPNTLQSYPNKLQLGQTNDTFVLYWTHNNTHITFELHVHDTKWVMFGLQNTTSMRSDAVLAWMNDDYTGYFANVVIGASANYTVNPDQNWLPLNAYAANKYTVLQMIRPIKLQCSQFNSANNLDLASGQVRVAFATGKTVNLFTQRVALINLNSTNVQFLNASNGPFNCIQPVQAPTFDSAPMQAYSHYMDLADRGNYRLYWNYTDTDFVGEVHVRTQGWLGFGFSPSGGMIGANVMIFWVVNDNVTANFSERYTYGDANDMSVPRGARVTEAQNWQLLRWKKENGYTIVQFKRPIVLCGRNEIIIQVSSICDGKDCFILSVFVIDFKVRYSLRDLRIWKHGSSAWPGNNLSWLAEPWLKAKQLYKC